MAQIPKKTVTNMRIVPTKVFSVIDFVEQREYIVNIDFDEAHKAWMENKIKGKNGTYKPRPPSGTALDRTCLKN